MTCYCCTQQEYMLYSTVHPMKYLESDVMGVRAKNVYFCLDDQSNCQAEKPMKVSLCKLSREHSNYKKVLARTLNSLILTSKRVHLTLFQPLVTEYYHANQYPHSTIVYIQQQQPNQLPVEYLLWHKHPAVVNIQEWNPCKSNCYSTQQLPW